MDCGINEMFRKFVFREASVYPFCVAIGVSITISGRPVFSRAHVALYMLAFGVHSHFVIV